MTGIQFFEKIIPEYPDTIRMILTGFSDIEAIIQAINTGRVFRYITKPWDESELKMTIDNGISLYRLQERNKTLIAELSQKVKEQDKTLDLFKRYVPASVVEKSLHATDNITIFEGELLEVAVLFCDIRGFTEISSDLHPKDVVKLLNAFYSIMEVSIKRHNGFVNQYVGDEIFAIFGAPLSYPDNHSNAVFCALDMIERLQLLNEKFSSLLQTEIQVGIGINSGLVVAGNLGSEDRIAYSITGDTVNTAKRIETLTKDFPNAILINSSTFTYVRDRFMLKAWEPTFVKAKNKS
jgi:class 3 adenylate cyclase